MSDCLLCLVSTVGLKRPRELHLNLNRLIVCMYVCMYVEKMHV
jgi:hypothetical protein